MKKQYSRPISGSAVAASLTAFCILLLAVAFLCASSAKGTLEPYRTPMTEPPAPATTSPEARPPETSIPPITGQVSTGVTEEPPITTEKPETPPKELSLREFYPDEHLVGTYDQDGVFLRISKVERGDLNMFICDVTLSSPEQFHTAFAGGKITGRLYTSKIAESVGATFAVNGDFCGYRSNGIIIREGAVIRAKGADWDLCYMDKNGDLQVGISDDFNADALIADGAWQSWCFGPTLVENYNKVEEMNRPNLSARAREPRTAIGQVDTLHYYILVVDAVRTGSGTVGGLSFSDLADQFVALGCKTAYNLDGGGSTTLYFNGQVINSPCVNGQRAVSDIIYLK